MAMFATAERFLAGHLKGRFQESVTPEVATRLKEITVDPATVTLKKKTDSSSVITSPTIPTDLRRGTPLLRRD